MPDSKEIKKASRRFRKAASNLMNCHFHDHPVMLQRFLNAIDSEECVKAYVDSCILEAELSDDWIKQEVESVRGKFGYIFGAMATESEQVAFVYLSLKYMDDTTDNVPQSFGQGYSGSNKYQDWSNSFNSRFVGQLIDAINTNLEEQLIDCTEEISAGATYNTYGGYNQFVSAQDEAQVTANQNKSINLQGLESAVEELLTQAKDDLDESTFVEASDIADSLLEEAKRPQPKQPVLRGLFAALKGVCNTTNLAAALITIEQFIQPLLE